MEIGAFLENSDMEIILRHWKKKDASRVAVIANNEKIVRNLRDGFPHPYTYWDALGYVKACIRCDQNSHRTYAVCVDGEVAGSISTARKSDVYRRSAEIGYWLGEEYWGKGIMTQAVESICREVFTQTDIVRIVAEVFAYNPASVRVLEKVGFRQEGYFRQSVWKNGAFTDTVMLARLKEE